MDGAPGDQGTAAYARGIYWALGPGDRSGGKGEKMGNWLFGEKGETCFGRRQADSKGDGRAEGGDGGESPTELSWNKSKLRGGRKKEKEEE